MIRGRYRTVRAAIKQMADEHLHCRDYGHTWTHYTVKSHSSGYEQALLCTRCEAQRVRLLDLRGRVVSNYYRYPDGYRVEGLGYMSVEDKAQVRLASCCANRNRASSESVKDRTIVLGWLGARSGHRNGERTMSKKAAVTPGISRCMDCGAWGERTGHMECPYPGTSEPKR